MLNKAVYSLVFILLFFHSALWAESSNELSLENKKEQRFRLARSPKIKPYQIKKLFSDPSIQVREALGRNRKLKSFDLFKLASDPSDTVRIAVATNLSTDTRTFLLLATDRSQSVKSVVARFEYVPAEALVILAKDFSAEIRLEVAKNLNTLEVTLNTLLNDSDPDVQAIASQALQRLKSEN